MTNEIKKNENCSLHLKTNQNKLLRCESARMCRNDQVKNLIYSSPSPRTPSTPTTPGGSKAPLFSFSPALQNRAATAKDALLMWCQTKTFGYEVEMPNLSEFLMTFSRFSLLCEVLFRCLVGDF